MQTTACVHDPSEVSRDPALPQAARALDPSEMLPRLRRVLIREIPPGRDLALQSIRVLRHSPGRRCLIEYQLRLRGADDDCRNITVLGKMRAQGTDTTTYRLQTTLWRTGLDQQGQHGVSVSEPLAVFPDLRMWLQRKPPGTLASHLLAGPDGPAVAVRLATAIHRLHLLGPPTYRRHGIADELRILRDRLSQVVREHSHWAPRLQRLLVRCDRLGATLRERPSCPIHRDFSSDRVIVQGSRSFLVNLDLYSIGDPALDVGNALGHLIDFGLRTLGTPDALAYHEQALEETYLRLAGEEHRDAIHAYTTLTLARHIHLSIQLPERRRWTVHLLELCEDRLGSTLPPALSSSSA